MIMEMHEKIRELRKQRKMTLEEVGNIVGVGKSTVRKWENGDIANMRRDKIAKLATALGTTPAYLMGWDEKTQTIPVKVESIDDFENIAIALEAAGAYEEAERVRKDKAENEQMITFIKLFQGLSPENKP